MAQSKQGAGSKGVGAVVALGAGVVAALATGYYLYGPDGTANRKKMRAWTIKAKGEMLGELEKMKEVSQEGYQHAVDRVTARYAKLKEVGEVEADRLNRELKRYWNEIKKAADAKPAGRGGTKGTGKKATVKSSTARKKVAEKINEDKAE